MLRGVKELRGYAIQAVDGQIGTVDGFLFDDLTWTIRYLVADTGSWLCNRRLLLSAVSLGQPEWEEHVFPVGLTKEQVENSPPVAVDRPVSRQMEERLAGYYGWPAYWTGAAAAVVSKAVAELEKENLIQSNPHLRSTREVIGYHIQATDGEIGHVEDFVVEDSSWVLRYLVINTRHLLCGKRVLVAPTAVEGVSWATKEMYVSLSTEAIENSPEFDSSAPIDRRRDGR